MNSESKPLTDVDLRVRWPSHESFAAAVAAVPAERTNLARAINRRLRGAAIEAVSYDGTEVRLRMSSGEELVLRATATGVDFQLDEAATDTPSECAPPEYLRLRFPGGLEYDWHPKASLGKLTHKAFHGLAPSETIVSLHVRDAPELLFDSMVYLKTDTTFLFFSES